MTEADGARPAVDWELIEESSDFRELERRKRRFILPATVFFLAWYFGFIVLAGYAPGLMGESLTGGLTVGYGLALTQFAMVWGLTWLYLRRARRDFDPLAERVLERAEGSVVERGPVADGAPVSDGVHDTEVAR